MAEIKDSLYWVMAQVCTFWRELDVFFALSSQSKKAMSSAVTSHSILYRRYWAAVSSDKWPNARMWAPTNWWPWRSFFMTKRLLRLRKRYIVCSTLLFCRVGGVLMCCNVFSLSVGQNVKESQLPQSPQHLKFLWEISVPGPPMFGLWAATQRSLPDYHQQWFGNAAQWNKTNCKAGNLQLLEFFMQSNMKLKNLALIAYQFCPLL